MPKFYEFNDSLLESIEQAGERVTIQLRAVRSESEASSQRSPNQFRQEIRLVLEGAAMSIDSAELPSWLMEGSFRAQALEADKADCTVENTLPVSLRSARGVELVLSGLHEGSGDFVTIRVQANSLTLEALGEPEALQHTRASI